MILRRVTEHVKAQNWFAVGLDFLIVVVGVFVGLQVSNWNAARVERAQERELLVRLHEDIVESINGQTRDILFLEQQLSDQAVILKSLDACAVVPDEAAVFQRGLNTLGNINPPRLFRRTIDEMAAAGKTDAIQNDVIKEQLADIVALVEWRANGYDTIARLTEHYRYIVEEQVRYNTERTLPDNFMGVFAGVDFDIQTLCENPATAAAVSAISNYTGERRRAFVPILERYSAFLPLVEAELRVRWRLETGPGATP